MAQNETVQAVRSLSNVQLTVMEALLSGSTVTYAASEAGGGRTTVHRWLREDWAFQAEMNRLRRDASDAIQMRLLRAAELAARLVASSIDSGDTGAALAVLRGLGLLGTRIGVEIPSDDPADLEQEAMIEKAELDADRKMRSVVSALW